METEQRQKIAFTTNTKTIYEAKVKTRHGHTDTSRERTLNDLERIVNLHLESGLYTKVLSIE